MRKSVFGRITAVLLSVLILFAMMPVIPGTGSDAQAAGAPTVKLAGTTLTAGKYYKNVVVSGKTTGVEEGTSADYNYYLSEDGTELELNGVATDAQLPDDPNDPNAPKNMIDVSGGTLTLSFNGTNTVKTTDGAAIHLKNAGLVLNEKGTGTNTLTLDGTEAIDIEGASSTITSNSANVTLSGAYAIQTGSDTTALTLDGSVGSKITTATSVGEDFYVRGSRMTLTVNNIDFKGFGETGIEAQEIGTGSGDALVINGNDAGHLYLFCEGGAFSGIYAMNKLIINGGNIQVGGSDPDDTSSTPTVHQAQIAILSYGGSGSGDIDINGGKIRTTSSLYSILSNNNMNISGGADVNATGTENTSIGLFSRGTMTVQGAGTQVSGTGCASGITVSDMVVKDGTVTGTGRGTIYPGVGIVSSGKIDISGGTVKGTAAGANDEAGIKVTKQKASTDADGAKTVLNISGGTVIADGGNAVGIKSGWANSYNNDGTIKKEGLPSEINISGGNVTAEGGQAGIRANGENGVINITGGTVDAKAVADSTTGTSNDNAGISTTKSGCTVNISGGSVTAEGAAAADTYGSYGIHIVGSGSSLAVSDGVVTAKGLTNGIYGAEDGSLKLTGGHIIADGEDSGDSFNAQPDVTDWNAYIWRKAASDSFTSKADAAYAFSSGEHYAELNDRFSASFDANGGQGGPTDAVAVKLGKAMPTISAVPKRSGYTFSGYYDSRTGGTKYYNANGTSARAWDKTENATLYAHWTVATGTPLVNLSVRGAGKTASRLSWSKVKGASGYDVYFAKCGWHSKLKRIGSQKGTTYTKTRLRRGATYKYYVRAYKIVNGKKKYIANSLICHSIAGVYNSRYTDAKKLTPRKSAVTLRAGRSTVISARTTKYRTGRSLLPQKHTIYYRFLSSNTNVAAVVGQGKVIAKSPGTCWIYIYAQNGVRTAVKITVRE